jgi:uncharacterized protein YodC (DUF2158 family)
MDQSFSPGDVVVHKSGGPRMTVMYVRKEGGLNCHWFDGTDHKNGEFVPATLRKAGNDQVLTTNTGSAGKMAAY